MTCKVFITAFGFFDGTRLEGTALGGGSRSLPAGAADKLRWSMISKRPCDSFRRMDYLSRFAVAAAEMLDLPELPEGVFRPDTAIVLGTRRGCFGVDVEFYQSMPRPEGASPMLFTYTLPNVAIGELAIRHHITGSNLCLQAGPESGLPAFWESFRLVERGEAAAVLCLGADAVSPAGAEYLRGHTGDEEAAQGRAYAFLMEKESRPKEKGRPGLAEILRGEQPPEVLKKTKGLTVLAELSHYLAQNRTTAETFYLPPPEALRTKEALSIRAIKIG